MRKLVMAALLIGTSGAMSTGAGAYEGPWCLQFSHGRSSAERCHYASFEACANERILSGSTAFCRQNSRYLPYWQGRGFGPEPVVHKSKAKNKAKKKRHHVG